jgi:hypothetical protein
MKKLPLALVAASLGLLGGCYAYAPPPCEYYPRSYVRTYVAPPRVVVGPPRVVVYPRPWHRYW